MTTIFLRSRNEVQIVVDILQTYEQASGAEINEDKSKALGLGTWDTSVPILGIQYQSEIKILGIHFKKTIKDTTLKSWAIIVQNIRRQAKLAYHRDLTLPQRVQYANVYLLSKVWYTAQLLPPTVATIRQIDTSIAWTIWHGTNKHYGKM
jgi:hypothetical protein